MSKIKSPESQLPAKPSLENLKKQARSLLVALRGGNADAVARWQKALPRVGSPGARVSATLAATQRVIAREYGFDSWPKLKTHVATATDARSASEPLYRQLMLVARRIEWVSKPELVRMKEAGDLPGLIAVGLAHCDAAEKEALLALPDPQLRAHGICQALERLLRESAPPPLGSTAELSAQDEEACLVVLHASAHPHLRARRLPLLAASTRIGRELANDLMLHSTCVSREHARIERRGAEYVLVDQRSTNGSYVNEAAEPVQEHTLADGDRVALGDAILLFLRGPELEAKYLAAVAYIAEHDALTRVRTREAWLAETERQVFLARGSNLALSALCVELDQFGELSKRIGVLAGDAALMRCARMLREALGEQALIGRCPNNQFSVTLPSTDAARALEVAESLRRDFASRTMRVFAEGVSVTISVGVATLYRTTGTEELLEDARAALEQAKSAGRNAVRGPREAAA